MYLNCVQSDCGYVEWLFNYFSRNQCIVPESTEVLTCSMMKSACGCNKYVVEIHKGRLSTIKQDSFEECKELNRISLYENQIISIPGYTFKGLYQLQKLELGGNKLTKIDENWFKDLMILEELHLQKNLISSVPQNILEKLPKLRKLVLFSNLIKIVKIDKIEKLHELYVADNPLDCSEIDVLKAKLQSKLIKGTFFKDDQILNTNLAKHNGFDCQSKPKKSLRIKTTIKYPARKNTTTDLPTRNIQTIPTPTSDKQQDEQQKPCECPTKYIIIGYVTTGINALILLALIFKYEIQ